MLDFGPDDFAARTNVSRKTFGQLEAYVDLLKDWNSRQNLVSRASLDDVWRRHVWDSAQLVPLVPDSARTLADLGSGAGFPGLVLAAILPDLAVTLHEATAKKCLFLAAAAERMGLHVAIENVRIEDLAPKAYDVVTARALAPLPLLLDYADRLIGPNSVCLFLKGQNVGSELTEAHKCWSMKVSQTPSQTDPSGVIVELRELGRHDRTQCEKAAGAGRRQSKGRRR